MSRFKSQKYLIATFIIILNIILSFLNIFYEKYWYIFIVLLSLATFMNTIYAISLFLNYIYNLFQKKSIEYNKNFSNKNLVIFVPCYNETIEELRLTFDSIYNQKNLKNNKILFIISDGNLITNENLKTIFKENIIDSYNLNNAYKTWDNKFESIELYIGIRNNIHFIIIVKNINIGKRDSITLLRRLLYYYNNKTICDPEFHLKFESYISKDFSNIIIFTLNKFLTMINKDKSYNNFELNDIKSNDNESNDIKSNDNESNDIKSNDIKSNDNESNDIELNDIYFDIDIDISNNNKSNNCDINDKDKHIDKNNSININIDNNIDNDNDIYNNHIIEFIYGTDADTELDEYCIYNLVKTLSSETKEVVACVGFVDLYDKDILFNYLKLYQYAEYYIAQLLRRNFQSKFTKKVNCLSGCNQLIKICEETCGEKLLELFNKKPSKNDDIFKHILYSASEDRNHVSFMFQLYPYVKTIQNLNSKVYTKVPINLKRLLGQRKRWNLGTFINDIMLLFNKRHNLLERIQSFINITVNMLGLYIFIATIHFIINIIKNSSMLMLYLSLLIIIPQCYNLITPIIIYRKSINMTLFYYLSYIYYMTFGPILNMYINLYTIFNMDDFKWNMN